MNRFDATTLWKTAGDPLAESGPDNPAPSDASGNFPSAAQGSVAHDNFPDGSPGSGLSGTPTEPPFSWSAALCNQTFFVPLHYERNYAYPLIVWLHSDGFNENQICHVMPHVSKRNYLATGIRAPQAADASGHRFRWLDSPSALQAAEQSVLRAIQQATDQFNVHPQRVVVAGYQQGGTMALQLALRNPRRFAAAVSLGGPFRHEALAGLDSASLIARRLPMLWQRSIRSPAYDEDALVAEIKAAAAIKPQLEVRQYCNEDEMNTVVLADLDRWIMEHVVGGAPVVKMSRWDTSPTSFSDN
jgi:phospholipase/carboxylesterase